MAQREVQMYIGGVWRPAADGKTFPVFNPADGSVWAKAPDASRIDAQTAILAAAGAQPAWAALPHSERAKLLSRAADVFEKRAQDFTKAIVEESGSWIGKAMFECGYVPGVFRAAAASAYQMTGEVLPSEHGKISMVLRQPLGVVTVISPWNFPAILTSRGFATALAVGNAVVLKPSEETPVCGGLLFAEILEEAGFPKGVFNVVTCSRDHVAEVGDEIVTHPLVRAVSFTGSTAVGRKVAQSAGYHLKKACLELGGKDALIICEDADLELAVNAATFGAFMHQGQICMSVERVFVHEAVSREFTDRFVANAAKLKSGDPWDMGKVIGPIINQKQFDKIKEQVDDAVARGAKVLVGGTHSGLYYDATVLTGVTRDMKLFQEETFGPIAPVMTFGSVDEAVSLANDSEYGLSAGVITRDEEKGLSIAQRLHTGMAHVNDSSVGDEPHVPFGGVKASGLGRHGGRQAVETFTETRWVTLERGGRHYPPPFLEKSH
jgi:acyl-CoA reductase-like NAD-dependent aldehyde dehydrogenase